MDTQDKAFKNLLNSLGTTGITAPSKNSVAAREVDRTGLNALIAKVIESKTEFDPEGTEGYNYRQAKQQGVMPDDTGAWPVVNPDSGQIMRGIRDPKIDLPLLAERELGNYIVKRPDGNYYALSPEQIKEYNLKKNKAGTNMFEDFVNKVFKSEGGFTVDQGGPTMRGVTWKDNSDLLTKMGYTKDTLHKLTKDDAKKIYETRYFKEPGLDKIPDDALQYLTFDFYVNSGPEAVKKLQKIVGSSQDGVLGNKTVKNIKEFIDRYGADELKHRYITERENFMKRLAKNKPDVHGKSLRGWLNRINFLREDVFGNKASDNTEKG